MKLKIVGISERIEDHPGGAIYSTENYPLLESIFYEIYNKRIIGFRPYGFAGPVCVVLDDVTLNEMVVYARGLKLKNMRDV